MAGSESPVKRLLFTLCLLTACGPITEAETPTQKQLKQHYVSMLSQRADTLRGSVNMLNRLAQGTQLTNGMAKHDHLSIG